MSESAGTRPWPAWLAVAVGATLIPLVALLLAVPGAALVWLLMSGSPRADNARVAVAWLAGCGVVGFAVGGWAAARFGRAAGSWGEQLALAAGVAAVGLLVAVVGGGFRGAFDLTSVGVALGVVAVDPVVPAAIPDWVTEAEVTIRPPDVARRRTLATLAYLVVSAALSIGAAGLGGLLAGPGGAVGVRSDPGAVSGR